MYLELIKKLACTNKQMEAYRNLTKWNIKLSTNIPEKKSYVLRKRQRYLRTKYSNVALKHKKEFVTLHGHLRYASTWQPLPGLGQAHKLCGEVDNIKLYIIEQKDIKTKMKTNRIKFNS